MKCEEAEEIISALADNQVTDRERYSIERHLRDCPTCKQAYERHRRLSSEIRMLSADVVAPPDLRDRILFEQRSRAKGTDYNARDKRIRRSQQFFRPAFAIAFLFVILISVIFYMRHSEPVSLAALQIPAKIDKGEISLRPVTNTDELHDWLYRAVDGKFGPLGYDFSRLEVQPMGGAVQEVNGRKILVAVFRGNGVSLMCFTFLGAEEDAPKKAKVFFDPDSKINFYSFSQNGINAVLHREENIICVLASNMPAEELLSLAKSQSPHKHRPSSAS